MGMWYLHPDGDEWDSWNSGRINRVTAPITVQRVEPEAAVVLTNGKVLAPLTDAGEAPGAGEVLDTRSIVYDGGSLTAAAEYTYRAADSGELAAILAAAQAEKIAAAKAKGAALIAAGFTYRITPASDYHTYDIGDQSADNMLAVFADHLNNTSNPHGGFWRSVDNVNVTMTTPQNKAFLLAAKNYKMAIIRNIITLNDAARAAADTDDLALIDTEAGSVDSVGSWPANGS